MTKRYKSACVVALILLAACSKNRDNHDHPNLITGEELYNHHCAECHGTDGTGKLFDRTPANILTKKTKLEIEDYIVSPVGRNRKMPVFATMPAPEAAKIAGYVLKLKAKYESLPDNKRKNRGLLIDPEHE